ncbi:hypothetical protein DNH61_06400 [Paenibacillus sambharensis]|uniref:Cytidyltransferase-like domain-containing protein n=1 Tax=Paenibacillus sambharensis TaxID=1803190 RepID=A0A2W1LQN7_9BACL|nr:adenylyltransferase/cytidyltransferase family protein [Paenibacillus sambharensis]PZD96824.1 hypothetical protein DNH61_06400 [Paenibacillus sambharensis]
MRNKIVERSELVQRLSNGSVNAGEMVLAGGCFDLFHVGHLDYLEEAAALGRPLIVGINSDESVIRVKQRAPLFPAFERCRIVAALHAVDYVFIFGEDNLCTSLELLRPSLFVKGVDYRDRDFPERETGMRIGCEIRCLGSSKAASSSILSDKLFERHRPDPDPGS